MRNWFSLSLVLCCVCQLSLTTAEQCTSKLAYVDTLTLLTYAPQRAEVEARLRAENNKMQEALSKMSRDLKALKAKLDSETNAAKQETLRQEILDKQTLLTRRTEAVQEAFLLKRNDEIAKFQKEINEVIANFAKKRQLDGVITQASVVYFAPRIDITQEVMQVLKSRHAKRQKSDVSSAAKKIPSSLSNLPDATTNGGQ